MTVRELQDNLRALGYLARGIDGAFGPLTERAVRSLQHDLLHNHGASNAGDGGAPVAVSSYNRGRVTEVTGAADQPLERCIADMMADPRFPKLPRSDNPRAENRRMREAIFAIETDRAPMPFVVAMLRQESNLQHYRTGSANDDDTYIQVGLDTNNREVSFEITSRGYGAGQYTLFHHPPMQNEVDRVMLDPVENVRAAIDELRDKFDGFVIGPTSATQADDRLAEHGGGALRVCKFDRDDPRFLTACKECAVEAGTHDIRSGVTEWYAGAGRFYEPTRYYKKADYDGVPVRGNFPCDWPYAARRYNGSGVNSYHYQARILTNLLATP